MIVDDDATVRRLTRLHLEQAGSDLAVVAEAASGNEALVMFDHADPDVVILDQSMPGLSGTDTASVLRRQRPQLALILFAGAVTIEVRDQAMRAGVDLCLPKAEVARLSAEVIRLWSIRRPRRRGQS